MRGLEGSVDRIAGATDFSGVVRVDRGESGDVVELHGYDAGVSFRTVHDPNQRVTHTVLSNTTEGAWPITEHLDELLTP
jgi:hypothetical protein